MSRKLHLALALISAAVMLTETVALRAWKVSVGLEAAYLMIPSVMVGFCVGAVVAFFCARLAARHMAALAVLGACGFAATLPLQFLILANPGAWTAVERIAGAFAACGFALAGLAQTLIFRLAPGSASSLYCATLLGSAVAAVAITPLLDHLQMQGTITTAVLLALAAVPCLVTAPRWRAVALAVAVTAGALAWVFLPQAVVVHVYGDAAIFAASNALAQVEVSPVGQGKEAVLHHYPRDARRGGVGLPVFPVFQIAIDDRTSTFSYAYSRLEDCDFLRDDPGYFAYFRQPRRAMICGTGGGPDVVQALLANVQEVTAVEINPLVVEAVRRIGSPVYAEPRVRLVIENARTYLSLHPEARWDAIVLPRVKTSGTASGFVVNVKNYMLTREALVECLRHLEPQGTLAIRDALDTYRWHLDTLVAAAGEGAPPPLVGFCESSVVLLFSPAGFSEADLAALNRHAGGKRFAVAGAAQLDEARRGEFLTTDDRPLTIRVALGGDGMKNNRASRLDLPRTLLFLAAGMALLTLPAVALHPPRRRRVYTALLVVAGLFLGIGYMLVELALMDVLAPIVGRPMWAVTTSIGAMMVAGGAGSLMLTRQDGHAPTLRAGVLAALAAVLLVASHAGLHALASVSAGELGRITFSATFVAVPAFFMGAPFPLLLQAAEREDPDYIPWIWAASGVGSLLAGVFSRPSTFEYGISATYGIGVAAYAIAALALCVATGRRG